MAAPPAEGQRNLRDTFVTLLEPATPLARKNAKRSSVARYSSKSGLGLLALVENECWDASELFLGKICARLKLFRRGYKIGYRELTQRGSEIVRGELTQYVGVSY
jgi:hypothetical protein